MEEHVTTQCSKAEHLCPFSCHGCEFKVSLLIKKKLFFARLFKANCGEMALIPPNQNLHLLSEPHLSKFLPLTSHPYSS